MAAAASYPFNQLHLTNSMGLVAGAGTTPDTIKAGQLYLADRSLNLIDLAATANTTASRDLTVLHVVSAKMDGQPNVSVPIPVDQIRFPISYSKYSAGQPQVYTVTVADLAANAKVGDVTDGLLRMWRDDNFTAGITGRQWLVPFTYIETIPSQQRALAYIADYITRKQSKDGVFTAVYDGNNTLTITGKGAGYEEIGSSYVNTFEATLIFEHLNDGSPRVSTATFTAGSGLGVQLVEQEQSQDPGMQLGRYNPFPQGFMGTAQRGSKYNTYGIRFNANFLADFVETHQRQLSVSVAFLTDASATIGAQEAAFVAALKNAIPKAHNLADADTTDILEDAASANNPANAGEGGL